MPFDNEYAIRLLIDAGLKINCFVGIQDGCVDGGNHECINSQNFFSRLSPLLPNEFLYITNHLFYFRKPVANRLPFKFLLLKQKRFPFDPACLSNYQSDLSKLMLFKVSRMASESMLFCIGNINVHVHYASIWDCMEKADGWVIPAYPPNVIRNYLPDYNTSKYLRKSEAVDNMLEWALENKHSLIASIPFDSDENMAANLPYELATWRGVYPESIHFYHLKKNELNRFRARRTYDHTIMLLNLSQNEIRYNQLVNDIETGKGDPWIVSYLLLQYAEKALQPLVKGLTGRLPEMRMHCVNCLQQLGDNRAVKPLIQMFGDPENEAFFWEITEAVGQLCGWVDYRPVYTALHQGSPGIRANMARLLADFSDDAALPELIKALKDIDIDVFHNVCHALGAWSFYHKDRDAGSNALCSFLSSEDPLRRVAASEALGNAGNPASVGELIKAIRRYPNDKDFHEQAGATLALISEEYDDACLNRQINKLLKTRYFLGKENYLNCSSYQEVESGTAQSDDHPLPLTSGEAPCDIPSEDPVREPIDDLIEQLQDPDPGRKTDAAEKLGERANRKATKDLCLLLYDYNPEVQLAAIKALRKIGDKRATDAFNRFLPQKTTYNRQEMVQAMGKLRDKKSIPVLEKVFTTAWLELKAEIVRAHGNIGGHAVLEPLIRALGDKHPKVRYIATWKLLDLQHPKALKALEKAIRRERNKTVKGKMEWAIVNYHKQEQ